MMSKDREYYSLCLNNSREIHRSALFSSLMNAMSWLKNSGINPDKMTLFRVEVWEDGKWDWHTENMDEALDFFDEEMKVV